MKKFKLPYHTVIALALAAAPLAHAAEPPTGQTAYEINCKACHLLDTQTVGPSMIRVASVYPKEKLPDFLNWAKEPGKKDPLAIEMPSMAHLSDETLASIQTYILGAVIGLKEKKGSPLFAKYREPKRKLPYVVYAFLPDTSPASIAIVLPGNITLCWDTELCRVRYAWNDSKTNISSWRKEAQLESKPFYQEGPGMLFTTAGNATPDYHGYRLIEGYPEFHYTIGEMDVRELVGKTSSTGSFTRNFQISGTTSDLALDLAHEGEASITSDQGIIAHNKLSLTPAQATHFTLTVSRK